MIIDSTNNSQGRLPLICCYWEYFVKSSLDITADLKPLLSAKHVVNDDSSCNYKTTDKAKQLYSKEKQVLYWYECG